MVGEINADLILSGNVIPAFGQIEQVVDYADLTLGSSAIIFACGAAKLGLRTAFIGKVGDDLFGRYMLESIEARGIGVSGIIIDHRVGTGLSVILANEGDRAILTYPGSIPELQHKEIDFSLLSQCRHIHLSSYFLLEKLQPEVASLFKRAKENGLSVSLDTNYDPAELWNGNLKKCLPYVDVFLPNDREAMQISGENDVEKALQRLSEEISTVVIKRGEHGAIAIRDQDTIVKQSAVTVEVVDTVGAGDSFDAGFMYGYLQDWTLEKTLEFAVACGSISTLQTGGTTGQPTLKEAQVFISRNLIDNN
ncbi:MAG: carbohydrate kinase family protein [Anaerolineales bacterium]